MEERGPNVEPYYTPSAILQEKSDSVKLLDLTRATPKQKATIATIRVKRGDIVVTRSGSSGRVAYITTMYHNSIVSDDLIRVRIGGEKLRLYVFQFLQSTFAQDQMLMNEYGAIQQHLEPEHVRNILVPIPGDEGLLSAIAEQVKKGIELKEALEKQSVSAASRIEAEIEAAIALANEIDEAA